MNVPDISDVLMDSIKSSYQQYVRLQKFYDFSNLTIPESYFAVHAADDLHNWDVDLDYSICLEYPVTLFVRNAFQRYREANQGGVFDPIFEFPNIVCDCRDGRVDLVLIEGKVRDESEARSKVAVEFKGISRGYGYIASDIERLIYFLSPSSMLAYDSPTFESSIEYGYCCFLKSIGGNRRVSSAVDHQMSQEAIIERTKNVVASGLESSSLDCHVQCDVVQSFDESNYDSHDYEYGEVAKGTGQIFAIVIKISKPQ